MYPMTDEQLYKLAQIYTNLVHIVSPVGHDPFPTSYMLPFKAFVMILPRAMSIGIPKKVNDAIGEFMDTLDADDVDKLMDTPVPLDMQQYITFGSRKYEDLTRVHPIATIRKKKGLTQVELAEKAGVNQKDISRWENFRCKPTIENLKKIADALDCKIDDLV